MAEPNTKLSGVKEEPSVFKTEFSSSFEKLKDSITVKFSDINARLDEIEKNISVVTEELNESIKLQNKVKKLEEQLLEIDQKSNHLDQYSRKNNIETQSIPAKCC